MNRDSRQHCIPAEAWHEPAMRDALATRDIATVYRLLGNAGISQRTIAALTSQSQSDIAAVLGGRQVMSYDLLERIATGLGISRGSMGLAYSRDCTPTQHDEEDESVKRRRFLAHAGHILTGAAIFGDPGEFVTPHADTPIPHRIGMTDVAHIEQATDALGRLERHYGGGLVLSAIGAQTRLSERLFKAQASEPVRRALCAAVARLHGTAAWSAYDIGVADRGRDHVLRGLELARAGENPALQAYLLQSAGQAELHHNAPDAALRLFHLAYPSALAAGSPLLTALVEVHEARAYGKLGARQPAIWAIASAREHFEQSQPDSTPPWLTFFTKAPLLAAEGMTWASFGEEQRAIAALSAGLRLREDGATLPKSFELTEVATAHLRNGDIAHGIRLGFKALDLVETLHSTRARDRLAPLHAAATRSGKTAAALTHRLAMIRADIKAR